MNLRGGNVKCNGSAIIVARLVNCAAVTSVNVAKQLPIGGFAVLAFQKKMK